MDLNLLSRYRTILMGFAVIMIIMCHAPQYGVAMPEVVSSILSRGGLGVDIFLFLSGLGCWFSLSKGGPLKRWYYKRFIRIFVPYFLIQIPFCFFYLCIGEFDWRHELTVFSTAGFWLWHEGAWYVALLLPLYLLTPLVYKLLQNDKRLLISIILIISLVSVCMLNIKCVNGTTHEIFSNLQWAFGRVPSFVMGMAIAPCVKNGIKVNYLLIIFCSLITYVSIHQFVSKDAPTQWCLVPPVLAVMIFLLNKLKNFKWFFVIIGWMGAISLESYLANIYLPNIVKFYFVPYKSGCQILYGGYLEYFLVGVIGIALAWGIHSISNPIVYRLSSK